MSHFRMLPSITEADAFLKSRSLPAGLEVRKQVDAFLAQARQTLALAQEAPWLSKQEVLETLADELVQTPPVPRIASSTPPGLSSTQTWDALRLQQSCFRVFKTGSAPIPRWSST